MAKTNNIIEINGKRYDSVTGAPLDGHGSHKTVAKVHAKPPVQPKSHKAKRQPAKSVSPHAPKHSQTLMRRAVKRPSVKTSRITVQSSTDNLSVPPMAQVVVGSSAKQVDPKRLSRAQRVPRSQAIQHFTDLGFTQPLPPDTVIRPTVVAKKNRTTADLLDHALKTATSHKQPAHKAKRHKKHGRKLAVGGTLAIAGLLIVAVGHQASLDLRLNAASATAGFDASLPDYKPPGYSLSQVNYNNDEIATDFHSNSNDSAYNLTRHRSDWDDQALVAKFVSPTDPNYKAVKTDVRTVYLYGNNNATWLDSGIWYVLQTDGSLNQNQLLNIVNSL